jgi:hypothetical protein
MKERVLMTIVLALALVAAWLVFGPFRPQSESVVPPARITLTR